MFNVLLTRGNHLSVKTQIKRLALQNKSLLDFWCMSRSGMSCILPTVSIPKEMYKLVSRLYVLNICILPYTTHFTFCLAIKKKLSPLDTLQRKNS